MKLNIHRGTKEIGGSCVQITAGNLSILLDAGLPLGESPSEVDLKKIVFSDCYERLQKWYEEFLPSTEGKLMIILFRENVPHHEKINDIKKVDFVLWQIR